MNGSRSNPSRQSDRTSLDALNRTIEGLEARIEGLMGSGREQRPRTAPAERDPYAGSHAPGPQRPHPSRGPIRSPKSVNASARSKPAANGPTHANRPRSFANLCRAPPLQRRRRPCAPATIR